MKNELTIVAMILMLLSSALGQSSLPPQPGPGASTSGTVAGLAPDLRAAVLHNAACGQSDHTSPLKPSELPSQPANSGHAGGPGLGTPTVESSSDKTAQASGLDTSVAAQDIRSAKGANVGTIVRFSDGCHCQEANCGTYVFLKSNAGYRLAFSGGFLSLHIGRVFKGGYPSLSGKVQLSKAQTESTVYDWNGKNYAPVLCATITQTAGRKVPSIVHHDCSNAP